MKVERLALKNLILIRLNPRDDLLLGLREAVAKNGIRNAVILSGVGSVVSHHYHVVASSINPPLQSFIAGEAPADIVNINGYVINGRIHAHIVYSDKNIAYGGIWRRAPSYSPSQPSPWRRWTPISTNGIPSASSRTC